MPRRLWLSLLALVPLAGCGPGTGSGSSTTSGGGAPLSVPEMEYAVVAAIGPLAYCDPDLYPLARLNGPAENSIRLYPTIQQSGLIYAAILSHRHLHEPLTAAQKLDVYTDWKWLNALKLTASGSGYSFDQLFMKNGSTVHVIGTVASDGSVTVTSEEPGHVNCPICLTAGTLIDTPGGPIRVVDIRQGMTVWSTDIRGRRVAVMVVAVGSMQAPTGHMVLRISLDDGRTVTASPGHPTADGRHLGGLRVGDRLDGGRIVAILPLPYAGFTYDLLPAGPTGAYWADGVLIGSTLSAR